MRQRIDESQQWADLDELVAERYVSAEQHPSADLWIYNYTPKTQYAGHWTPTTLACRGLILDGQRRVIQRPFPKFFNHGEYRGSLPREPFEVYEKLDGSLGILYWVGDEPALATRGSFTSAQALRGTALLRARYAAALTRVDRSATYLFEILYPENRIVVDYGEREDVVLLAVLDTATGAECPLPDIGFPIVPRYDGISDLARLEGLPSANREGFVVRFASGLRLKVKFAEYVRLHRLVTGVTERTIWELLAAGTPVGTLLERVPEEFAAWTHDTVAALNAAYAAIEEQCHAEFRDLGDRKATALYYQTCQHPTILFKMLDGRPYADTIWRLVRPEGARPFRREV
jgi:RNA ligase